MLEVATLRLPGSDDVLADLESDPAEEVTSSGTPPPETPPPSTSPGPSAEELAQEQRHRLLRLRNIVPLLAGYVTENAQVPLDEDGRWHGVGDVRLACGQHYEGDLQHGLLEGQGTMIWPDGTQYTGQFQRNAISGHGTYTWPSRCQYTGTVCCGRRHGYGVFSHPAGYKYLGTWQHGAKHGQGKMFFGSEKASIYEGNWKKNQRDGYGDRIYPSGNNYSGYWVAGRQGGSGTMRWYRWGFNLEIYHGEWKAGLQHGQGTHVWQMHQLDPVQHPRYNSYTGQFRHGQRHGTGVFQYASDATFTGRWSNNLKSGPGQYVDVVQDVTTQDFVDDKVMYVCEVSDQTGTMNCVYSDLRDFDHLLKPTYQLDIEPLLQGVPEERQKLIKEQVWTVVRRHISELRRIYSYYAGLGASDLAGRDYVAMTQLQWWQMMRDCEVHLSGVPAQVLMGIPMLACGTSHPLSVVHFHEYLLMFLLLADILYTTEEDWQLAERVGRFMEQVVLVKDARTVSGLTLTLPLSRRPQRQQLESMFAEFERQSPATVRSAVRALGNGRVAEFPAVRPVLILRAARQVVPLMVIDDQQTMDMELELTFIDFCELLLLSRRLHRERRPAATTRPATCRRRRPPPPLYDRMVRTYALQQYKHRMLAALRELAAPGQKKPPAGKSGGKTGKRTDKAKSSSASQLSGKDKDKDRSSLKVGRKSQLGS